MSLYASAQVKLRKLAMQNAALATDLGATACPPAVRFRWFNRQLWPGEVANKVAGGTCVSCTQAGNIRQGNQSGIGNLEWPRLTLTVYDLDSERARSVAEDIVQFMTTVDLCSNVQFCAPLTVENLPDITGTGATIPLSTGQTTPGWVQVLADPGNAAAVIRLGDSTTSDAIGLPLTAGAGMMLPPEDSAWPLRFSFAYIPLGAVLYVMYGCQPQPSQNPVTYLGQRDGMLQNPQSPSGPVYAVHTDYRIANRADLSIN